MRAHLAVLALVACNGKSVAVAPPTDAASDAVTPVVKEAPVDAGPSCPPIDTAKTAPFTKDDAIISTAIPPIVDPNQTLAPFYARIAGLARGTEKKHVRIAMYGDSALTADATTGRMRRQLQKRFGDGGHGYVALARPWEWYSHNDVHHDGTWKLFKFVATSTNRVIDNQYGFAGIAGDSANEQASTWVSTDPRPGAPIGFTASHFEVYYAMRPDGGRFTIELDGKQVKEVDTHSADAGWAAGFETIDTEDAHHELKMRIKNHGTVRLYGATLERDTPSIIVDSLGVGAGNMEQLTFAKPETRVPQWKRRNYDLVIVQLGTNMFNGDAGEKKYAKQFLESLHGALPNVPVLFMTPPDAIEPGTESVDQRLFSLVKTFEDIAKDNGTALWNYYEAMGGKGSIKTFVEKRIVEADHVHLKKQGFEMMADRFLVALFDDLGKSLAANPSSGCR